MNFKDVIIKNFKKNINKYRAYFLCITFSIIVFFMYSTLIFNKDFKNEMGNIFIRKLLDLSTIVLILFSIFFISYALSSFIKSRRKEFGILLALGLTKKNIRKMIAIENIIIILISLIVGLTLGTIFSYLMFNFLIRFLNIENILFSLTSKSYLLTILIFIIIFSIENILNYFHTRKFKITELLKVDKRTDELILNNPLLGILGLLLIIQSFVFYYNYVNHKILVSNNNGRKYFILMCLVGLYLLVSQFGTTLIKFTKFFRKYYYKNLLKIAELKSKFTQNRKIIFIISITSIIIVVFLGAAMSLYFGTEKMAELHNPHHIMFAQFSNNKISNNEINSILNKSKVKINEYITINFLYTTEILKFEDKEFTTNLFVLSQSEYNNLANENLSVNKGEIIRLSIDDYFFESSQYPFKDIILEFENKSYAFKFQNQIHNMIINRTLQQSRFFVILNDFDFNNIKSEIQDKYVGKFHIMNFIDWKKTNTIVNNLKNILGDTSKDYEYDIYKVSSRINYVRKLNKESGIKFFIVSFIGILFFISCGSVLYLKMITDIDDTKRKFKQLSRIGITKKEFTKIISTELFIVFFTPCILGSIIAYTYLRINTLYTSVKKQFSIDILIFIFIYFAFQAIFYYLTKKKYVEQLTLN